jgi:translation initiation factor IF-3
MIPHIEFNLDSDVTTIARAAGYRLRSGTAIGLHLKFRGREMAHVDMGFSMVNELLSRLKMDGRVDAGPKLIGRNIRATLAPVRPKA